MDQDKDKKLDELFSNAMHNHDEVDFREQDWNVMEDMLNMERKPIVMWMRIAGTIAAMLLIALGMWWLMPRVNKKQQQTTAMAKNTQPKREMSARDEVPLVVDKGDSLAGLPVRGGTTAGTIYRKHSSEPAASPLLFDADKKKLIARDINKPVEDVIIVQVEDVPPLDTNNLIQTKEIASQYVDTAINVDKGKTIVPVKERAFGRGPVFALNVFAAPDVNGVGAFSKGSTGVNAGVLLSLKLNSKLTISTGAAYSYKPYNVRFSQYHTVYQFAVNPTNVMADCRVLDIPLNVDYKFYNKKQNSFSLGAGLSSWFMLNEKYSFTYADNSSGYVQGPASYNVSNQNKHILGVLNLQATYQRQLNQRVGVAIQPFMKLPLTDIGYSEVRLQSLGIAAGVTWNLSP